MANLTCSASNCAYNNGGSCYSGGISVAGVNAVTTSNTTCSSFVSAADSSFTNCANCTCTKTENISCQASNCTYNANGSCKAQGVQINAQNASCETFVCR